MFLFLCDDLKIPDCLLASSCFVNCLLGSFVCLFVCLFVCFVLFCLWFCCFCGVFFSRSQKLQDNVSKQIEP